MKTPTSVLRAVLALALAAAPVSAQQTLALSKACQDAGGSALRCDEAAVAARAVQGHVGLMGGLGAEVPGSAGTLGRRLGTTPRVAVSARAAFTHVGVPDPADQGDGPAREAGFVLPAVQGYLALGLFDGFSPLPTVGGIFSLDVLGNASVVFLPKGEGFDGAATMFSFGARVGLLRESFTLPGVAVSVSRRVGNNMRLGTLSAGDRASIRVDPSVTAIRATVGKDLLGVGILAGMGWDRYGGSATVELASGAGASTSDFTASRTLVFGGASLSFLVLQMSGEIGWAQGFDAVPSYRNVPYDITSGTVFGSLAFRLTI
jgi:hypothetical protein